MENKKEKAITAFKSGFNCAQSVVVAFAGDLNYDRTAASNTAVGFGGGMGRLQETCGAVTGAFMVLGLYNSSKCSDNLTLKNATYSMIRQFDAKFKSIHSTTNCKALLQCDLSSDEGHAYAVENRLFEKICEKCIADAVGIIEELIAE
ncbi:MAG TPA: C-GCAxxG-C-C family protein [Prolixibacteraceae bacterium]|nr:C-GCAxxG-C-C family protein [Prolixibacteraceae bacterium]